MAEVILTLLSLQAADWPGDGRETCTWLSGSVLTGLTRGAGRLRGEVKELSARLITEARRRGRWAPTSSAARMYGTMFTIRPVRVGGSSHPIRFSS